MKTIALLNEKGGVGKTTLAVHIAAGLAVRGQRVLVLDADAQANATVRCGHKKYPGLYDLLVRDGAWTDQARVVKPHDQETYIQLIGKIQAALRTLADSLDFEAYALDQALFDAEKAGLVYIVPDQPHDTTDKESSDEH